MNGSGEVLAKVAGPGINAYVRLLNSSNLDFASFVPTAVITAVANVGSAVGRHSKSR